MTPERLLAPLSAGHVKNVRFADLIALVEALGFTLVRRRGSHDVYSRPGVVELVNLQEVGGQAKPYQIRQVLQLIERYDLRLKERE